ncbi:MAG TPA: preprotein translocase subunit SecG [Myxococcales bacterium]
MYAFIIAVHVIVSVFLIFVILLQPAKSDGMGAVGGGGGGGNSSSVFGGRGSVTFLSKVTTVCAVIFMVTSLTLAWRSSHSSSVLQARRNLAAQDTQKKNDKNESSGPLSTPLPTGQTAPAPVTGGAVIPAQGSGSPEGNQTPATPAPASSKGPGAPTAPPTSGKKK